MDALYLSAILVVAAMIPLSVLLLALALARTRIIVFLAKPNRQPTRVDGTDPIATKDNP